MIGTELLNLMYGDPLRAAMAQASPNPTPNPNPQAPRAGVPGAPPVPPAPGGPRPAAPISPTTGQPMPMSSADAARNFHPNAAGGMVPNAQPPAPAQPLPQSGPPSTAPQSPTDLGQLYMQLYNRQRSANEIDRGLSMMAAANASPNLSNAILNSGGRGDNQDPAQAMNMLLQMRYMQQLANMPAPPGMESTWAAMPPDLRAKVIAQQATTNLDIAKQGTEQKQKDFIDAQHAAPGALTQMGAVDSLANQVNGAVEADGKTNVMEQITNSATKRAAAQAMLHAATADAEKGGGIGGSLWNSAITSYALTPEERSTISNLIQLQGQVYGEEFKNAGSKRTQQEIKGLVSGATQLFSLNQPYENYQKQFSAFQNHLHTTYNNTLAEAGRLDEIPENQRWDMSDPNNPKPMVDSAFLPNGDQYRGGGQWASSPPKGAGGGPVQITGPGDIAKLPHGTPFIIPSGPHQGQIGYAQ